MSGKVRQSGGFVLENICFMEETISFFFYSSCEGSGHRTSNRGNLLSSLFKYFQILRTGMMGNRNRNPDFLQRIASFLATYFIFNLFPLVGGRPKRYTYLLWTRRSSTSVTKNNTHSFSFLFPASREDTVSGL